jgi:SSS family solute:Na+ symporter
MTKKIKSDEELKGLVYSLTPKIVEEGVVWYKRPAPLAIIVGTVAIILSLLFW